MISLETIKSFFYSPEELLKVWIKKNNPGDLKIQEKTNAFFEALKNVDKVSPEELKKKYFECVEKAEYNPKLQKIFIKLCSKQESEKSRLIINDLYKSAIGVKSKLKEE